jgi:hypothetical protein
MAADKPSNYTVTTSTDLVRPTTEPEKTSIAPAPGCHTALCGDAAAAFDTQTALADHLAIRDRAISKYPGAELECAARV